MRFCNKYQSLKTESSCNNAYDVCKVETPNTVLNMLVVGGFTYTEIDDSSKSELLKAVRPLAQMCLPRSVRRVSVLASTSEVNNYNFISHL